MSPAGGGELWRRISKTIAPVQAHLVMGMAALVASTVLMTLDPLIGRVIIDEALAHKRMGLLYELLVAIAVIFVLALIFESIGLFLVTMCMEKVRIRLQAGIVRRQLRDEHSTLGPGECHYLSTSEVAAASSFVSMLPANICRSTVQLVWAGTIVTMLSPAVGLATLFGAFGIALLQRKLSDRIANANGALLGDVGTIASRLQQVFSARRLIRQHHREGESLDRLRGYQEQARGSVAKLFLWETAYFCQQAGWSQIFTLGVIAITGLSVVKGTLTVGQYIAISIYVARLQAPLQALLGFYKEARKNLRPFNRVLDTLQDEPATRLPAGGSRQSVWGGTIEARDLRAPGLEGASFRIERGSRVLFSGEDQRALTAVLELLAGSTTPQGGALEVGGRALSEMPATFSRRWAAVLAAEPQLLAGTLRENLCFGAQPASSELAEALAAANLTEFAVKHGLENRIDPTQPLSPELRHGIQLARALLIDPELWLVEDFTGAVSHEFAARVFQVLQTRGKTIVAAGGRGDLLELADRVIWVEGGRCGAPESIDAFLAGVRAPKLVPQGRLQLALQGKGASEHAERWARRQHVSLASYSIELFGDERRSAVELPVVAEALRRTVRDADLVLVSGKARVRCVFLGNADGGAVSALETERRLVQCVHRALDASGAADVFFEIEAEKAA